MIFTSITFLIFFTIFFLLYWFVFNKNLKLQNLLVLFGSYVFYAWWDWRLLSILAGTSVLNFILGIYIEKTTIPKYRKILLWLGLLQGIGGLALFKYYNFFFTSINQAFASLNINFNLTSRCAYSLNIALRARLAALNSLSRMLLSQRKLHLL